MKAYRLWERFEDAAHDNPRQMTDIAQKAIETLEELESSRGGTSIKPHLFNQMVNDVLEVCATYGKTQQLRTHIAKTLKKYLEVE
ncbi:cell division topological specificity factor [Salmonella phage SSBI34]|nr:cell division topological specificity factor [Salmonella phage SSBI34]